MKTFVMKNWRNIIFAFSGLAILINLIMVIFTPNNVINDYYKYGPDYSKDIVDSAQSVNVDAKEATNDISEEVSNDTGISFDAAKVVVIFAVLICAMLMLQNIMDGNQASGKKK